MSSTDHLTLPRMGGLWAETALENKVLFHARLWLRFTLSKLKQAECDLILQLLFVEKSAGQGWKVGTRTSSTHVGQPRCAHIPSMSVQICADRDSTAHLGIHDTDIHHTHVTHTQHRKGPVVRLGNTQGNNPA